MSKFLDFLEIGTSDFNALIIKATDEDLGISIDPVQHYLDKLPNPKNWKKLNIAISDREGSLPVRYIHPDDISKYNLPEWLRGCNSIENPHPTAEKELNRRGISHDIIKCDYVRIEKLTTVLRKENISGIYQLKVDTEGHDVVILKKFFHEIDQSKFPHELIFETNMLSDSDEVHSLIAELILSGYEIVKSETGGGQTDTFLRLNILRLKNRSRFCGEIKGYYLSGYPADYDPKNPPHENTLAAAMRYCKEKQKGGVTYQYGRHEVREGKYLKRDRNNNELKSWILIGN